MNLISAKIKNLSFNPIVLCSSRIVLCSSVICLSLSLAGCGVFFGDDGIFRNRENDYLKADNISPLILPEGVKKDAISDLYPVPPISAADFGYDANATDYEVPRPMPLSANMLQDNVKIQRVGENSWVLVNAAPGELWPRVRNFLNANGLTVSRSDLKQGIIETDWLQFKTDLTSYDRYRLQIDQGVQPETSEIHITHMNLVGSAKPAQVADWPARSMNAEREKWLLDELAATLASDIAEVGTSMLAQSIGGASAAKANLGMLKNEPIMTIKLDQARTMATLAYAAKHDGFQLFESDASLGLFYVYYKNPEDAKPGWFRRFFHIGLHPKPKTSPYSLAQITTNLLQSSATTAVTKQGFIKRLFVSEAVAAPVPTSYTAEQIPDYFIQGKAFDTSLYSNRDAELNLPDAPGYLITVSGKAGDYLVRVRDPYGKRLKAREARELLTVLRKNLI
jgi:outer membrane protein assembly factor BamC